MTDTEKKLLQAQHRLEEAQARDRGQGAQSQNAQAHSGGCDSGKRCCQRCKRLEPSELEDYLITEAAAKQLKFDRRSPGNRGPSFFRRAHFTHHLLKQAGGTACGIVRSPRGDCGCCGSLQTMPRQPTEGAAVIVCADWRNTRDATFREGGRNFTYAKPAWCGKTCHRQLCHRDGRRSARPFSLRKRNRKKRNEGKRGMAIYHLEAKVVSRGAGRYCSRLRLSELFPPLQRLRRDTMTTRKSRGLSGRRFSCQNTPYRNGRIEKSLERRGGSGDSQRQPFGTEFVVALPIELSREEQIELLQEFIREQFVADGMCADAAIHDTDGHNPHVHILLTVRPLDEQGKWQYKTEKGISLHGKRRGTGLLPPLSSGRRRPMAGRNNIPSQGRQKKVYEHHRCATLRCRAVRVDKHPKSTATADKISDAGTARNSLQHGGLPWADVSSRHLERAGRREERIDHPQSSANFCWGAG